MENIGNKLILLTATVLSLEVVLRICFLVPALSDRFDAYFAYGSLGTDSFILYVIPLLNLAALLCYLISSIFWPVNKQLLLQSYMCSMFYILFFLTSYALSDMNKMHLSF